MKKNIQVIIRKEDSVLGPINTTKSLALGYVFNYLIPNNIVEIASKGKIKHINMLNDIKFTQAKISYNNNLKIKTNLEKIKKINIRKKLGQNQQIFGRITENEVIEYIFRLTGKRFDKKQIKLPDTKALGIYDVNIRIQENINTTIKLQILPSIL